MFQDPACGITEQTELTHTLSHTHTTHKHTFHFTQINEALCDRQGQGPGEALDYALRQEQDTVSLTSRPPAASVVRRVDTHSLGPLAGAAGQLGGLSTLIAMATHNTQLLRVGQRLLRCMAKYFASEGRLAAAGNAALLGRALRQRVWEDGRQLCRQLPNGALGRKPGILT